MKVYNRILIFGGTAAGKTTFARQLSKITGIFAYSTDFFVYKKEFTSMYDQKTKEANLLRVVKRKRWIIEGVHGADWILPAVEKADIIILLNIPVLRRMYRVLSRSIKRKLGMNKENETWKGNETWKDTIRLCKYVLIYRYDNYIQHLHHIARRNHIIIKNSSDASSFLNEIKKRITCPS